MMHIYNSRSALPLAFGAIDLVSAFFTISISRKPQKVIAYWGGRSVEIIDPLSQDHITFILCHITACRDLIFLTFQKTSCSPTILMSPC